MKKLVLFLVSTLFIFSTITAFSQTYYFLACVGSVPKGQYNVTLWNSNGTEIKLPIPIQLGPNQGERTSFKIDVPPYPSVYVKYTLPGGFTKTNQLSLDSMHSSLRSKLTISSGWYHADLIYHDVNDCE